MTYDEVIAEIKFALKPIEKRLTTIEHEMTYCAEIAEARELVREMRIRDAELEAKAKGDSGTEEKPSGPMPGWVTGETP